MDQEFVIFIIGLLIGFIGMFFYRRKLQSKEKTGGVNNKN